MAAAAGLSLALAVKRGRVLLMKRGYISRTTGEIVWSVLDIIPRLIERDWRGNLFFNLVWKREK